MVPPVCPLVLYEWKITIFGVKTGLPSQNMAIFVPWDDLFVFFYYNDDEEMK